MMALDSLLYFLLGWYIDNTLPNRFREFGVARPWYFPFTLAYWREVANLPPTAPPSSAATARLLPPAIASSADSAGAAAAPAAHAPSGKSTQRVRNVAPPHPSFLEPLDAALRAKEREGKAVVLTNLRKEFSTPDGIKVAVDDVSLSMHEGQITCLLGHNGAGKSTTISMLTGLLPPTDGLMSVFGRDVSTDLTEIRKDLGVCPQHDVLWPELTVQEHLVIFCAIKGVPVGNVAAEVDKGIREVGLTEKRNAQSSTLSGGQKRKLSVAIALIGGSRVVVLDEPTSGMDPYSRRATWEALQNARQGRVLLLTTHFMDEADLLGDRIIIMAQGQVRCAGSPMFLKRAFGVGYVCTVIKRDAAKSAPILAAVRKFVPEASVATNVGAELGLRLPLSASSLFPQLFASLEADSAALGVDSFGVSVTTLEDVFLKVAHDEMPATAMTDGAPHAAASGPAAFRVAPDVPSGGAGKQQQLDDLDGHGSLAASYYVNTLNPAAGQPKKAGNTSVTLPGGESASVQVKDAVPGTADSLEAVRAAARRVDSPAQMFVRHFGALFCKRWHNTKRDSRAFCYQLLIPAIMLAVGLGLIKSTQPSDAPGLEMSTSPLNANRAKNVFAQDGPNRVPYTTYLSGASPSDDPALRGFFERMPQGNVTTLNQGFTPAEAAVMPNTFGFHTAATYPQLDWQRMSTKLIQEKGTTKESRYGAYVVTRDGTPYPSQPDSFTAATSNRTVWTFSVLHNTTFKHGGPTFINVFNSEILRSTSGDPGARITVRSHPLPYTIRQANLISSIFNFGAAIIIVIAYSFIPASQVQFIVREREVNAKYQQIISGVSLPAYWLANYVYDVCWYAIPGALAVALIAAFDIREWIAVDEQRAAAVVGIFALYGFSVTSSTYLLSWCFSSYSTASNVVLMLNLGASFITM